MIMPVAQFGPIGFPELLVFALVILLLFGHRLPGIMRSLGRGVIEFKRGIRGEPSGDDSGESQRDFEQSTPKSREEPGDGQRS